MPHNFFMTSSWQLLRFQTSRLESEATLASYIPFIYCQPMGIIGWENKYCQT
jgi:hypothetical protein